VTVREHLHAEGPHSAVVWDACLDLCHSAACLSGFVSEGQDLWREKQINPGMLRDEEQNRAEKELSLKQV